MRIDQESGDDEYYSSCLLFKYLCFKKNKIN
jgi:hypothetical protein